MTLRYFFALTLLTLLALAAPILALWAAHGLDHATGWYDPTRRT